MYSCRLSTVGDFVIFEGDCRHSGAEYAKNETALRLHFYITLLREVEHQFQKQTQGGSIYYCPLHLNPPPRTGKLHGICASEESLYDYMSPVAACEELRTAICGPNVANVSQIHPQL